MNPLPLIATPPTRALAVTALREYMHQNPYDRGFRECGQSMSREDWRSFQHALILKIERLCVGQSM